MITMLTGPLGPVVAIALAAITAWKAAELLEVGNVMAAAAVGLVFAIAGPWLAADLIMAAMADLASGSDADSDIAICTPHIGFGLSRAAFALLGVLAWTGIERTT